MVIEELFTGQVINNLQKDIENSSGHEIYLVAKVDDQSKKIVEYNLLARGNSRMVPAIISDLKPGNIIIHNHPSGDLTPSPADIRLASRTGNNGVGFIIINNDVDQAYVVVEPKIPDKEIQLDLQEILSLFESGDKLDKNLEGYEYREQQLQVLKEVASSFNENEYAFIEAGTGTGKSFAYLIPALYWGNLNNQTVVVSTNTISLQEQLIEKDLVLLKKVLPFSFKSVLVKGRRNYLCKRKLKNLEKRAKEIFADDPEKEIEFIKLLNWIDETESGSRSELNFVIKSDLWQEVASESDLCLRGNCPYFDSCFFMKARKEVYSADLLVVNHHLLISDALVKMETGDSNNGVLPGYRNLIIDEAHNFGDIATRHLGRPFYNQLINKFLQRLNKNKFSLLPRLRNGISKLEIEDKKQVLSIYDNKIIPQLQRVTDKSKDFFNELMVFYGEEDNKQIRLTDDRLNSMGWKEISLIGDDLAGHLNSLGIYLNRFYEVIINLKQSLVNKLEDMIIELESAVVKCQQLVSNLDFNIKADDSDYVFWMEKKQDCVNQENAPLDISSILAELIWNSLDTLILTSATLTVNHSFEFFKEELGLCKSNELQVDSPFDYSKQAALVIPTNIPPANDADFLNNVINDLKEALISFGGSTMVLFTSYRMLNYCVHRVEPILEKAGINLLPQGRYPRKYILENFRANKKQIIFGTASFWEGIDIKGDDLKYLIIMRLPFPVPDEPVAASRMEEMKKMGKNPFYNYSLPRAVIRFKQGFGRLIRSRKDEGYIIVLDNRIINKSYGSIFIKSLPDDCPVKRVEMKLIKNIEQVKKI